MADDILTFAEFATQLLREVPELKPVLDEHIADNDELLRHGFLGDVTRSVREWYRHSQSDSEDARQYDEQLRRTLDFLERAIVAEDDMLRDLIVCSFLENLGEDRESYIGVRDMLGPQLKRILKHHEHEYGWPDSL